MSVQSGEIIIGGLLGGIGFFLIRFVNNVDDNTKATNALKESVIALSGLIRSVQDSMLAFEKQAEIRWLEVQKEIDILRKRSHDHANCLQALSLKVGLSRMKVQKAPQESEDFETKF